MHKVYLSIILREILVVDRRCQSVKIKKQINPIDILGIKVYDTYMLKTY